MNWSIIQPLAGGMALGAKNAIGSFPNFILSQKPFEFNDSFLLDYWGDDALYYFIEDDPKLDFSDMDLVVSVPVCAGLSQLNSSKTRGSDAPQNANMLFNSKYALEKIKPKVYIFENAPGLFTSLGEGVVEQLKIMAKENGYSFSLYKTNTLHHMNPQNRRRTFALFWKDSKCPMLDYCCEKTNLKDYFSLIPEDASYQDVYVNPDILKDTYYYYILNNPRLRKMHDNKEFGGQSFLSILAKYDCLIDFAMTTEDPKAKANALRIKAKLDDGKNYWDHTPFFLSEEYIGAVQGRLYGRTIHPFEARDLNVRELIHLMGHPHDYMLKNDPVKHLSVIGQNVPVGTAEFITNQAIKFLNNELPMTDETFLKQDNTKEHLISSTSLSDFF